ncbi:MAG: type II toxin-antitoxin system RelE/ParE family toxin [Pirellulales bacterium]
MTRRVVWDRDAERDLDCIWDNIAKDNPTAANGVLRRIFSTCELLASQPLMGEARPELGRDLRSLSVVSYVIFFRPHVDGIGVARVLHGAQDVDAQFPG